MIIIKIIILYFTQIRHTDDFPSTGICKMCCPTSDIHSTVILEYAMWSSAREKIPSDPVASRVRGMVVGQGS